MFQSVAVGDGREDSAAFSLRLSVKICRKGNPTQPRFVKLLSTLARSYFSAAIISKCNDDDYDGFFFLPIANLTNFLSQVDGSRFVLGCMIPHLGHLWQRGGGKLTQPRKNTFRPGWGDPMLSLASTAFELQRFGTWGGRACFNLCACGQGQDAAAWFISDSDLNVLGLQSVSDIWETVLSC